MKRQSALINRPGKRKGRRTAHHPNSSGGVSRDILPFFSVFHKVGSGLVKIFLLATVITVISVSFLSLYHYLLSSPYMKLEEVEVKGVDGKVRDELVERCGLNSDLSLLALNLNELKQRMEEHPWVRSVRLERRFPNSLFVQAEKEQPLGVVVLDKLYYVNRRGEVFKEIRPSDGVDFPLITGLDEEGSKRREQLERAVHLMRALESEEEPWSWNQLSEVHLKEDKTVSLYYNYIAAEIKLVWSDFGDKMNRLRRVARHLSQTGHIEQVMHIDLTYGDGVVVSFRKDSGEKVVSSG